MPAERALDLFAEPDAPAPKWVAPLLGESVLGIDPSLTGFATCMHVPGRPLIEGEWKSDPAKCVRDRMARCEQLVRGTLQAATAHHPSLVLIEAYSYGSAHRGEQGHHDRLELGGILRWKLCELLPKAAIVEVAPSSLKKFTTGDGKAGKPLIISSLASKFGRRFGTDNAADAFALCQLGLALTGQAPPPSTKAERAYLAALRKLLQLPEVA
jgi:Holliday junction resolvasome RuvABC endonuclease subunit